MRVTAITNSRIPSLTANSIQAMKVCEALVSLGHSTTILAPREGARASGAALRAHYGLQSEPLVEWRASHRLLRRLDFALRCVGEASRQQADLIYTWLPQAAILGLRRQLPVVLEMHGDVGGSMGARWLRAFWRTRGPKRMSVTTRALRSALERSAGFAFPEADVIVAPNGVDLDRYRDLPAPNVARRQLGLREGLTAGFTGHLYPGRGDDLLFGLARALPEVEFLWVGGTPDTVAQMQTRLREGRLTNVTMTGFVENSRLPLYQAAADVLLMPYGRAVQASSGQEIAEVISPMKMFEYMAAGRAILTSDLPVLHEVLDEGMAVFCEPANLGAWVQSLQVLIRDDARRSALGARARAEVEGYTWTRREERILADFPPRSRP
jgi:glycosyltransferase involved in cell wall biosynthesis